MSLSGVLKFTGLKLSDAVRHAEMLGCLVRRAWLEPETAASLVSVRFNQCTADALALEVLGGQIAFYPSADVDSAAA
jgi:putative copper export protein